MADNQIVISDQAPQTLGVTPKVGEKLWCVVTDNGTTYKISKICIANSDVWSDPVDVAGAVSGGLNIADGDKGDIIISNTGGTWTIDNKAVTFAKLADMATGKLLGRSTTTAGSPEVIDIDSSLLLENGTLSTNAKTKAIAAQTSIGVIQSTGPTTAAILPIGAMGGQLLATVDDAAVRAAIRCRKTASANVVFTIAPTGNDVTGDGLGAGTEYATLQRAINEIAAIDGNGFTATIVPQPGTYAGATLPPSLVGWSRVSVIGAAANTITINTPLVLGGKTPIALRYLTFAPTAPATNLTSINAAGVDLAIRQCVFTGGDAVYNHITSSDSVIRHIALITTNGTFGSYLKGTNTTVYHSGTINAATAATFTSFFDIADGAIVQGASAPTSPIGTFTGAKYNAAYVGFADTLIPGNIAGVRSTQAFDPTLQSIADTTATGLIQRNANESVTLLPTGAMAAPLLAAGDAVAVQSAIQIGSVLPEIYSDNYTKKTLSIKAGGLKTDERWLFIPVFYDNYTRVVVSREYSDDSNGYGALSAVLEVSTGVWNSSGTGAFARIQKINEYGWPGAFVGATAHLLREVRLLESNNAEYAYSGLWLKVMGDRTYKISGCNGTPVDYATYVPTIGTPLAIITPPGMGTVTRIKGNYYYTSNGEEIDPVILAPNGSRWRVSVSNTGVISTTAI